MNKEETTDDILYGIVDSFYKDMSEVLNTEQIVYIEPRKITNSEILAAYYKARGGNEC